MKYRIFNEYWFGIAVGAAIGLIMTRHWGGAFFCGFMGLVAQAGILGNGIRLKNGRMVSDDDDTRTTFLAKEQAYLGTIMALAAAVIQADNNVDPRQLGHIEKKLRRDYSEKHVNRLMALLRHELTHPTPVSRHTRIVADEFPQSSQIQLVHFLVGVAISDGLLRDSEYLCLRGIVVKIGLNARTFESILAMFSFRREQEQQKERPVKRTTTQMLDAAYRILEIEKTATDAEIKRAYRRLAVIHHPDKVAHLGAEFQKAANEKFQIIVAAYELLQKERKFT